MNTILLGDNRFSCPYVRTYTPFTHRKICLVFKLPFPGSSFLTAGLFTIQDPEIGEFIKLWNVVPEILEPENCERVGWATSTAWDL